ncbi:hypothetical protein TKK_0009835 [Trichogramma kaykai]
MQYFQAYIFILCIISVISFYIFLQTEKNTQIANAKNDSIKRKFKKFKQTTAHTQSRKPLDDAINEKSSEISIETLQEIHTGDPRYPRIRYSRLPLFADCQNTPLLDIRGFYVPVFAVCSDIHTHFGDLYL